MMIFKKVVPRRTFLRGVGAAVALPFLDSMVPAFASSTVAAAGPAVRLSFIYIPNGAIMDKWTPASEGSGFEMTPILQPLAPFRHHLTVLSGLNHNPVSNGANHVGALSTFLTGVRPKRTLGSDIQLAVSVDQIAAKELGKRTQLASLELSVDSTDLVGAAEGGFSGAYINTMSWRTPTTPMPVENHPRAVFERLFSDNTTTDPAERLARIQEDRSILDLVTREAAGLLKDLGPKDRTKVTEYLDAIRETERRIQMAKEQGSFELPVMEAPGDMPANYEDHAKLMFDLQVLAYQGDLTRVITFMMGRERSDRVYREIGIDIPHHPLSHHRGDPAKIAQVVQLNTYHSKVFSYFLERLRSTPDGDGNLLDHSLIVYGSGLSDGNRHTCDDLPLLLVGGGAGRVKGGRHLRHPMDTPLTNLYLTMLDIAGVPVESHTNSTGKLELLSVA